MPITVVLLVLLSALAHAAWNALLKKTAKPEDAVAAVMLVAGASGIAAALVLRAPFPPVGSATWAFVSGLCESAYFVTLARALARAPLGTVYTVVRGGALVVVWPISILLLGEHLTVGRGGGTVLVALGLLATGFASPPTSAPRSSRGGLAAAAICAVFVAGYHLAYKVALDGGGRPEAVVAISLGTASAINLATLGARRPLAIAALVAQPVRIVVGGLLASAGFLIFLRAMKNEGAGVILTLRNTSILFAQILAVVVGERPRRLGVAGAVLVTLGAVLLAQR